MILMVDDSLHTHQGFEDFFHSFFLSSSKKFANFMFWFVFVFVFLSPLLMMVWMMKTIREHESKNLKGNETMNGIFLVKANYVCCYE